MILFLFFLIYKNFTILISRAMATDLLAFKLLVPVWWITERRLFFFFNYPQPNRKRPTHRHHTTVGTYIWSKATVFFFSFRFSQLYPLSLTPQTSLRPGFPWDPQFSLNLPKITPILSPAAAFLHLFLMLANPWN